MERQGLGLNACNVEHHLLEYVWGMSRERDEQAVQAEGTTSGGLVKCLGDNRYQSSHRKSCGPFSGFHFVWYQRFWFHQNGISPAPLFRGLKPDRFVKWPWIESFGAVSQKSTCRAGVKRQLPIIPTRCQASFKGWRLKIKHTEASRLDHSQKIKHIKASRLDHSQKIKHFEISPEGHSRASLTLILNTI